MPEEYRAKILIAEDTDEWREIFQEALEQQYFVKAADTYDKARAILDRHAFDVAVVDIRLSEGDITNVDGMKILEDIVGAEDVTSLIIVSGYGTVGLTRDAFARFKVLDFIEKDQFDELRFVGVVDEGIRKVRERSHDIARKALLREIGLSPGMTTIFPGSTQDQNELLQILLEGFWPFSPLAPATSRFIEIPGEGYVVQIIGWSRRWGEAIVARLGTRDAIQTESRNYKYAKGVAIDNRTTEKTTPIYKQRLGGLAYILRGAPLEIMRDFASCYANEGIPQILLVVEDLFRICTKLYESKGIDIVEVDLSSAYQDTVEQLVTQREKEREKDDYYFEQMEDVDRRAYLQEREEQRARVRVDPIEFVQKRRFSFVSPVGIVHGNLRGENIVVDSQGQTWLVGFSQTGISDVMLRESDTSESAAFQAKQTGKRSLLHDFVTLEAFIREMLLHLDARALEEFDIALSRPKKLSEPASFENRFAIAGLNKAFTVITKIRDLANEIVKPGEDMQPYYAELLYQLLGAYIRLPEGVKKSQAFASSAALAERLDSWR